MLLVVALMLACSAGDCPINEPGSPIGPDVQAFLALKAQPRPAGSLHSRVGDARLVSDGVKELSFRHDPLLTLAERRLLRGK